jgi:hypothetical protein
MNQCAPTATPKIENTIERTQIAPNSRQRILNITRTPFSDRDKLFSVGRAAHAITKLRRRQTIVHAVRPVFRVDVTKQDPAVQAMIVLHRLDAGGLDLLWQQTPEFE